MSGNLIDARRNAITRESTMYPLPCRLLSMLSRARIRIALPGALLVALVMGSHVLAQENRPAAQPATAVAVQSQ